MNSKILVFTATYNEAKNIDDFIKNFYELGINADLLIIDDNSPDSTANIINKYLREKQNLKLIVRSGKLGLDSAHKDAFNYAKQNKYNILITMDSDLSHDLKMIPNFINEIENSYFIIGSRYIKGGKNGLRGWRLFLSSFGNKFIKFIFKIDCNEFTTSYRAFNLKKMENFNLNEVNSKGYSFFMETIYLINSKNYPIKELPIFFRERQEGKSKIPKIELLRTFINVLKLKFKL